MILIFLIDLCCVIFLSMFLLLLLMMSMCFGFSFSAYSGRCVIIFWYANLFCFVV